MFGPPRVTTLQLHEHIADESRQHLHARLTFTPRHCDGVKPETSSVSPACTDGKVVVGKARKTASRCIRGGLQVMEGVILIAKCEFIKPYCSDESQRSSVSPRGDHSTWYMNHRASIQGKRTRLPPGNLRRLQV